MVKAPAPEARSLVAFAHLEKGRRWLNYEVSHVVMKLIFLGSKEFNCVTQELWT